MGAELGLPQHLGEQCFFETASGRQMQTGLFQATIVVQGHTANVRVSEAEEEDEEEEEEEEEDEEDGDGQEDVDRQFGFSSDTDEAVLGYQALAQLGLLVDCRRRRLVHSSEVRQG